MYLCIFTHTHIIYNIHINLYIAGSLSLSPPPSASTATSIRLSVYLSIRLSAGLSDCQSLNQYSINQCNYYVSL